MDSRESSLAGRHTYANADTPKRTHEVVGERCAEGVEFVRVLSGSLQQVTDGDAAAHRHHVHHLEKKTGTGYAVTSSSKLV